MLVADPAKRPSVAQLLQHPWVAVGLPPGMLQCNEKVRRQSIQHMPFSRRTAARWTASCSVMLAGCPQKLAHSNSRLQKLQLAAPDTPGLQ